MRLEKEKEKSYPINYHPLFLYKKESIAYFIHSFINKNPDFRATDIYGDLREVLFSETRRLISENIGFDIDSGDYDAYAIKFGYLTKAEIIKLCE